MDIKTKKAVLRGLVEAEKYAADKVLYIQKELTAAQTDLVGVRKQLLEMKEEVRQDELSEVRPVYGQREMDIEHLKQVLPQLLEKI